MIEKEQVSGEKDERKTLFYFKSTLKKKIVQNFEDLLRMSPSKWFSFINVNITLLLSFQFYL